MKTNRKESKNMFRKFVVVLLFVMLSVNCGPKAVVNASWNGDHSKAIPAGVKIVSDTTKDDFAVNVPYTDYAIIPSMINNNNAQMECKDENGGIVYRDLIVDGKPNPLAEVVGTYGRFYFATHNVLEVGKNTTDIKI